MGWWNQRTSLEKLLSVTVIIGAIISISLLVSLVVVAVKKNSDDNDVTTTTNDLTTESSTTAQTPSTTQGGEVFDEICLSKACIDTSSKILAQIDESVDPCEDFYEFSCGAFLRETVIPDDKASITSFNTIEDELRIQLRKIVEEPVKSDEMETFKNVKNLYKSCMDTVGVENEGLQPIWSVLNDLGGWQVLLGNEWDADGTWNWENFIIESKKRGFSPVSFFSFNVDTDFKESTKRTIEIDQPHLGLAREFLINKLDDPFVTAYHNYQVDLAVLLGAERVFAQLQMRDVLEFEFKLAEISKANEDRRDPNIDYNKMTIAEAQTRFPYVSWIEFFNGILPLGVAVSDSDSIVSFNVDFFQQLGEVLSTTLKQTIANYGIWRVVMESVNYLTNSLKERQHEFNRITTGKEVRDARWQECVDVTLNQYSYAFGSLYVRKHFQESSRTMVLEMVDYIKSEFGENLNTIDWMDEETKSYANIKLNAMKSEIGFADEIMNDAVLTEFYSDFPALDATQYFTTIHKMIAATMDKRFKRLRDSVDNSEWTTQLPPAIVMAYYYMLENSIKFPAAFLQGVFFSADRPQYTNYGGVGIAIGHEITHGFDDQGSNFDSTGNLRDWWGTETKQNFLQRAGCIVNQFASYIEPTTGLSLNGINTQGENIADNGGIKYAYRGYQKWAKDHGTESKLPGLKYNPSQLFWISFGQQWCSVSREQEMRNKVITGIHSPERYRVIGSVHNMEEFAKDFNCPLRSPMNPAEKCEVW